MPGSSLIRVYTVCHSVCIIWTHYSMVEPHSSNFRVIATNVLGVQIFRKFRVYNLFRVHYEEKIEGQDCGDEVGEWLSDFLGLEGLRLVRYLDGMEHRDIHWMGSFKGWEVASAEGDTVIVCMSFCMYLSLYLSLSVRPCLHLCFFSFLDEWILILLLSSTRSVRIFKQD